jgi:26S proteasome regulatory subunit T1
LPKVRILPFICCGKIERCRAGFKECRRFLTDEQSSHFLDRAIQNRICASSCRCVSHPWQTSDSALRLIAEHHISLTTGSASAEQQPVTGEDSDMIGVVDLHCSPKRMINACADFVAGLCEATYGRTPGLVIDGAVDTSMAYVPVHVCRPSSWHGARR